MCINFFAVSDASYHAVFMFWVLRNTNSLIESSPLSPVSCLLQKLEKHVFVYISMPFTKSVSCFKQFLKCWEYGAVYARFRNTFRKTMIFEHLRLEMVFKNVLFFKFCVRFLQNRWYIVNRQKVGPLYQRYSGISTKKITFLSHAHRSCCWVFWMLPSSRLNIVDMI